MDQRRESLHEERETAFPAAVIIKEKRDQAVRDWPETPSLPIELPATREIGSNRHISRCKHSRLQIEGGAYVAARIPGPAPNA